MIMNVLPRHPQAPAETQTSSFGSEIVKEFAIDNSEPARETVSAQSGSVFKWCVKKIQL